MLGIKLIHVGKRGPEGFNNGAHLRPMFTVYDMQELEKALNRQLQHSNWTVVFIQYLKLR